MKKRFQQMLVMGSFILLTTNSFAQNSDKNFTAVDDYVRSLGKLDSLNMGSISVAVTQHFSDKMDKVRALFDWVSFNIELDLKAARSNAPDKNGSDGVLKSHKASSAGYAILFQDLCSAIGIRCLTVDGYMKHGIDDINIKPEAPNHTWNVVQLGQTKEEWYYIDVCLGSGYTDKDQKIFTKSFNDDYFFANKPTFNLQCFPDNIAWQLNSGPKSLKDFSAMPVIKPAAYQFHITNFAPLEGLSKAKTGKPVKFTLYTIDQDSINVMSLKIGTEKKYIEKQVSFGQGNGIISFTYTFDEANGYPIAILINGKEVLDYSVEVSD
jgi:hypothetical protein